MKGVKLGSSRLSKQDQCILCVKSTLEKLQRHLEKDELCIKNLAKEAIQANRGHDKQKALHKLALRKRVSLRAQKRRAAILNLDDVLSHINDLHTDHMVLNAYKSGTDAIRTILTNTNMTVERAEAVMNDLDEALENKDEVENTLFMLDESDLSQLEEELDQIVHSADAPSIPEVEDVVPDQEVTHESITETSSVVEGKTVSVQELEQRIQQLSVGLNEKKSSKQALLS